MANNNWNNYTEKTATPVDADEVMVRDSTDGKNKKLLFGTFWKWVAKKLNEATISELQTSNKTIVGALNQLNSETLVNAYMGNNFQKDYVLSGMSTYLFSMSFVGDSSIVNTFFAVITTGYNASKTGKIFWIGNSAENYVKLTDGVTLHLYITSDIWVQCALSKL